MKYCIHCGSQVDENDRFCMQCGKRQPVENQPAEKPSVQKQNLKSAVVPEQTAVFRYVPAMQPQSQSAKSIQNNIIAYSGSGQMVMQNGISAGIRKVSGTVGAELVAGPVISVLSGFIKVFSWLGSFFKHPVAIIPAILFGVMLFLARKLGDDDQIGSLLSMLTYSAGMERAFPGMLSGIIGIGTVASAFSSLFLGGIGRTVKGAGALLKNGVSFGSILTGMGISAIWYKLLTGLSQEGLPLAISGILLLLQAVTLNKGYINTVCAAFSRLKTDSNTLVSAKRYKSTILGAIAGIAVPAALGGKFVYSYILPLIVMAVGWFLRLITKTRDTKLAKE